MEFIAVILTVVGLVMTLVLTMVGWMLKQGKDNMGAMATSTAKNTEALQCLTNEQTELRIVLVGLNGDGGLNSEVKRLRVKVHRLNNQVQKIMNRLDLLERKDGRNPMEGPHGHMASQ